MSFSSCQILSYVQLKSSMCCVFETEDCSGLQPMTETPCFLPVSSFSPHQSALHPLTQPGLVEEGGESLLFGEWPLGPNGNPCLLQQPNPEAGGNPESS